MANEGIMALPQGMGMQGEQPEMPQQRPTVTSAESYDAAQTALGRVNPGEQAALKEALRQNIGDLQLTPQQLDALIQVFEYVSQHPGDYKNLLQKMLEAKVLDEGDMPAEYDPEFIGAMLAVLNEMQQMQAAGAQEPMDLSPTVQGLQPMNMASGGLADVGQYLASKGRGGDSILAHINPEEAAMLRSRGGSGTINPITGLPEFKGGFLGGVFDAVGDAVKSVVNVAKDVLKSPVGRILGTIALATVLGPAGIGLTMSSATAAGLAGAGVSLLGGGSIKEALISGAMGYIGGGGTIMGANPLTTVGKYLPGAAGTGIGQLGGALNTGLATGIIGAGIGKLGGMSTEDALKMGLVSGVSAGGMKAFVGDPGSYATKSRMLALHDAGDPNALALHDAGDLKAMDAYLPGKSAPASAPQPASGGTTAPGAVPTATELLKQQSSSPFPGVPPATNAEFPGVPPATDAQFANLMQRYQQPPSAAILGTTELPGISPQQAALNANNLGAGVELPLLSSNTPPPFSSSFSSPGQQAALDANNLGMLPGTQPTGFFDKMVTGAGEMYDKYLSPDRPLPPDAGLFRKYAPLAAAGTAAIAAFGGMDASPAEIDEMTAAERARYMESRQRAKERRDFMEKGGYGLEKPALNAPYNPIVPTSYSTAPVGMPGTVVPGGVTQNPAGVAQPYNVAGLYGVPLIYGPDGQPRRMAQGGTIGRFKEGGDAGYEERRRRAQERQDFIESGGYGLEGNVFDPSQKRVRYRARMPEKVERFDESGGGPGGGNDVGSTGGYGYGYGGGADAPGANADGYGGGDAGFGGGSNAFNRGGDAKMTQFPRRDGPINGRGTGTSDDIPAMLSDGEFVFTAKAVRNAGGGSRRKGAARMYKLMKKLEGGAVKGN